MPEIDNHGSTARDFAMLERNILSHVKLALMLSLVSFSVLLKVRLVPEEENTGPPSNASIPIASVQMISALCALTAGAYEYHRSFSDMLAMRAFLKSPQYVFEHQLHSFRKY
jgi:hypothetical protein